MSLQLALKITRLCIYYSDGILEPTFKIIQNHNTNEDAIRLNIYMKEVFQCTSIFNVTDLEMQSNPELMIYVIDKLFSTASNAKKYRRYFLDLFQRNIRKKY